MEVFSSNDIAYAESMGISSTSLSEQWKRINEGFETIELSRAALVDDGIYRLSEKEESRYISLFEAEKSNYSISKFIPASGAASRMFQPFREMKDHPDSELSKFIISKLASFPFYDDLIKKLNSRKILINDLIKSPEKLAHFILEKDGMDYDDCPKGLIPFYKSKKEMSCAFEQHLAESKELGDDSIYFSVSEEYRKSISSLLNDENVILTTQNPSTHYISMFKGDVLKDNAYQLILRPSGHGALLKNLNEVDADLVFIKNIDNIQASEKNEASLYVKRLLGGFIIELKQQIDTLLFQLEEDPDPPIEDAKEWIAKTFSNNFAFTTKNEIISYLHRPIRIAGMVLNEGKAGGGPFWVKKNDGDHLQIVEGSQINRKDAVQENILNSSTHFNPVDIACSLIDHRGKKFDLFNYVNNDAGFLSKKQVDGKEATIMERPGLWNGSMANWLTLFIEIPLESFTPVKTVLDLLPKD